MSVVGEEFDAHEADFLGGVVGVVLELVVGLLEVAALGLAPVVHEDLLVLLLDVLVDIVVDVEFGAGGDDVLHLGHELVEGHALADGHVVEALAAVDGLDDVYLVLGLAGLAFSITAQYFAARAAVTTVKASKQALFDKIQNNFCQ